MATNLKGGGVMELVISVVNQKLKLTSSISQIIAGSQKFVKFIFNLSSEWDGLTVFAQFIQNDIAYNQYLNNNTVYLPSEIQAGFCKVVLCGTGNTVIATTNYLELKIDRNILISDASSTNISQSLYDQLIDRINGLDGRVENMTYPCDFGAIGDGVSDDTIAFQSFCNTDELNIIPKGSYKVFKEYDGESKNVVYRYSEAALGNGDIDSQELWTAHYPIKDITNDITGIMNTIDADIAIGKDFSTGERITPSIVAVSRITENEGHDNRGNTGNAATDNTAFANIYSYIEQTGNNSVKYPKAIAGVTVNASGGNNDSSGVVGYSCKLDVPASGEQLAGIGDAVGTGGAAWQYSNQKGLVLGGEFAVHQNVAGTYASPVATAKDQTIGLHITTKSTGSPVWSGISIDAQDTVTENVSQHYGYWNAITIMRSCFAQQGRGYTKGTVGISMANCKSQYPEKAMWLGNADYHFYRSNGRAIRSHCASFDIISHDSHSSGMRIVAKKGEMTYYCYENGEQKYYTAPDPDFESTVYIWEDNKIKEPEQNMAVTESGVDESSGREYIKIGAIASGSIQTDDGTIYLRNNTLDKSIDTTSNSTYIGFYEGELGAEKGSKKDSTQNKTIISPRAIITSEKSIGSSMNNQLFFRVYNANPQNSSYVGLSISNGSNALRPLSDGAMHLGHIGALNYRWADIHAFNVSVADKSNQSIQSINVPIKGMLGISNQPIQIQIFGDSISDDRVGRNIWIDYLQDYLPQRILNIESCANAGSGIGVQSASHSAENGKMNRLGYQYDNVYDLITTNRIGTDTLLLDSSNDFVIVLVGTNDFTAHNTIGNLGDLRTSDSSTNTNSFYGAARAIIEHVTEQCPNAVLIMCTPPARKTSADTLINGEVTKTYTINNVEHSVTLRQYCDAMIDCCEHYGIPYIDLFSELNWNPKNIATYTVDGVHPNILGSKRIAKIIADKIKTYIVCETESTNVTELSSDTLPFMFVSNGKKLQNYRIYGNENGVGDLQSNNKYAIPITISGKNIYNAGKYPLQPNKLIYGVSGENSGKSANGSAYAAVLDFIPCSDLRGKTLILNKRPDGNKTGIAFYSEANESSFVAGVNNNNGTPSTPISFVVPNNAAYMRFCVPNNADEIQIEIGSTSTSYEPYQVPINITVTRDNQLGRNEYIDFKNDNLKTLRTLNGTNILSVGTTEQPSRITLQGAITQVVATRSLQIEAVIAQEPDSEEIGISE